MNKLFRCLLFICCLGTGASLQAQTDELLWQDYFEQWMEQNETEEIDEEVFEMIENLKDNPVNLNDTSSETLLSLPFMTPFKWEALKAYIRQNGSLYSYTELSLVRGFDASTIALLRPLTIIAPVPVDTQNQSNLKYMLTHGRSSFISSSKIPLQRAKGYQDSSYCGSPFGWNFRYQYRYSNRLIIQFSGDKDAGEQFFGGAQKQGFDYYGGYAMVNDWGIVKRAVVGKYQLQFGQGLTLWSGSAPWQMDGGSVWRYSAGIHSSSAFCEYGYFQGAAATLAIGKHTDLTPFFSYRQCDATPIGDSMVTSLYYSGYHRTTTERNKIDQVGERVFGANIHYQRDHLSMGVTGYLTHFNKPLQPTPTLYNYGIFQGQQNANIGADISYRLGDWILFWEMAFSHSDSMVADLLPVASLVGAQFFQGNSSFNCYYRYYSPTYHNFHASPLGQNANCENEQGFGMNLHTQLPYRVQADISSDIFQYPWFRSRCYGPSVGSEYKVRLLKEVTHEFRVDVQYRYKASQRNRKEVLYKIGDTQRHQFQINASYAPNSSWHLQTRMAYTLFDEEKRVSEHGFLICQDLSYSPNSIPLTLTARYAVFEVDDYDARIYSYENDLVYEFSTPAYNGQGYRFYLLLKYDVTERIKLGFKYGRTQYFDREVIGSGHDAIQSDHKDELKVQLRVLF